MVSALGVASNLAVFAHANKTIEKEIEREREERGRVTAVHPDSVKHCTYAYICM